MAGFPISELAMIAIFLAGVAVLILAQAVARRLRIRRRGLWRSGGARVR